MSTLNRHSSYISIQQYLARPTCIATFMYQEVALLEAFIARITIGNAMVSILGFLFFTTLAMASKVLGYQRALLH